MKPLVLDGSPCLRSHSRVTVIIVSIILSVVLFISLSQGTEDQSSKAVRRTSPDQKRVALVIGNSDYKDMPLKNPAHDADDIAKALRELGFIVQTKLNVNQQKMEDAVREFVREIQNGDVGLFYFSGHGVQVSGENYLIPVAASIETETDCRYKAVNAGLILGKMEESKNRINICILDACRNNPFKGFRSMSKGLTMMDAPVGTFIAYATAPGSVAADGTHRNSPYAKHLMQAIKKRDLGIEQVFKEVLREVRKETDGKQIPWTASSLHDDFYFNPAPSISSSERPADRGKTENEPELIKLREAEKAAALERERLEKAKREHELEIARLREAEKMAALEKQKLQKDRLERKRRERELELTELRETQRLAAMEKERLEKEKQELLARISSRKPTTILSSQDREEAERIRVAYEKDKRHSYFYNDPKVLKRFRQAAEQGDIFGQNNLGWLYQHGFGVSKDNEEAVKWYRKAADQGDSDAQMNLGRMYLHGLGISKDNVEGMKWYRKAADQGDAKAQYFMGTAYLLGNGVPQDYEEAAKWYKKAADQGNVEAKEAFKKLGVAGK